MTYGSMTGSSKFMLNSARLIAHALQPSALRVTGSHVDQLDDVVQGLVGLHDAALPLIFVIEPGNKQSSYIKQSVVTYRVCKWIKQ